jgi:uncharacterized membrane protein YdfJ with MMPL/SSD domain
MRKLMLSLDAFVRRRRRLVLGAWLLLALAAAPFAARQSDRLSGGGFDVPGSSSLEVERTLERQFPQVEASPLAAVIAPGSGATRRDVRRARQRLLDAVAADPRVGLAPRATERRPSVRRPVLIPLRIGVGNDDSVDVARGLRERLGDDEGAPVRVHLAGYGALWSGLGEVSKEDLERAEMLGFPLVALILLAVFGSLAAAALPLALGAVSVMVTGALIYLLSLQMEMSVFVTNMASMIGIGVAVDYSLFVLARYREEVREGHSPEEARGRAMASSGVAVLFSGLTVMVSLAGLWLIPNAAIRSMALGAILVVAVSMLASATLLPALIALMKRRAVAPGRFAGALGRRARLVFRRRDFWTRWTRAVMRRPVVSVLLAAGALLAVAAPTLELETGAGSLRQFPADAEAVAGARAAARASEPGASSPVFVLLRARDGSELETGAVRRLRERIARDPAVSRALRPARSRDGRDVLITAVPRANGEAPESEALVERLRTAAPPGIELHVGGSTAGLDDIDDMLARSMWKIVAFVLGLSFVVLVLLLRSIVLPLKAVVMNLLSVGAAYGVLVAVFQWGWLDGLLGYESPGYIEWLTPPLVLAVVFGLSMDYEVFLLSRIRERYEATGDTTRAVAEGLASSARTITSAALIMVAVFAVFIGTGVESIKQLGLGNAVAIAIDATLVRLVLLPAAMQLFGRANWWFPRGLTSRVAPNRVA